MAKAAGVGARGVEQSPAHTAPAAPPLPALCLTNAATPQKQTSGFPPLTCRTARMLRDFRKGQQSHLESVFFLN